MALAIGRYTEQMSKRRHLQHKAIVQTAVITDKETNSKRGEDDYMRPLDARPQLTAALLVTQKSRPGWTDLRVTYA